jgi:hypothetical protein
MTQRHVHRLGRSPGRRLAGIVGLLAMIMFAVGFGLVAGPASADTNSQQVSASVDFHDPTCADQSASWAGVVDGHADSAGDGVTFAVTGGAAEPGDQITVTATAQAGFTFAGGGTSETFTHTYTGVPSDCGQHDVVVTPSVVFHNPDAQDQTASWAGYVNGAPDSADDGVSFAVTSGTVAPGATVTITATAEAGYVFPCGATTRTFTHTFTQASGQETTVVPSVRFHNPTPQDQTASWAGYVNGVQDMTGDKVQFEVTAGSVAPGVTVTVTATAQAGYVFPGGETTKTFTHTFTQASGQETTVVPSVKFRNATVHHRASWAGYVNGVQDMTGDKVKFEVTAGSVAPGATVTVTATAQAGYVFPGGETTKTFTHTFPKVSVVATVRFHNATVHHRASWAGYVNGVKDTTGEKVKFEVTAGTVAPGATVTVTATAQSGYVFRGGVTTRTFTHTFTRLGLTGVSGTGPGHSTGTGPAGSTSTHAASSTGTNTAGTTGSGFATAGQGGVPTSVEAGQTGQTATTGVWMTAAELMFGGGALLLLVSAGLMVRKPRAGAHRA